MKNMNKFKFPGLILLMTVLIFAGTPAVEAEADQLVISTWGFGEDLLWEHVFTPFEEEFDVEIVLEVGNNADRLQRVIMRGGTEVDIIYLAESYALEAISQDVFAEIDRSLIPNLDQIYDIAVAPHGEQFGPAYTLTSYGIVYDSNAVDESITSWADLWDSRFENNLSIPEFDTTSGPAILFEAADLAGVDYRDDLDAVFAKLEELKPNLVTTYPRSSELANMFAQGEVIVGPTQSFAFDQIKAAVEGAVWVYPEEGGYVNFNTVNIVKNSDQKELAHQFINFLLREDVQQSFSESGLDSPVNVNVELTEEQVEELGVVYGLELIESLKSMDWDWVNENKQELLRRWDRELLN